MSLHHKIRERFLLNLPYHMTHIENLSGIFAMRAIKCFNEMKSEYHNIANDDVQAGRSSISIQETGRSLHDYVPLYLGFKTPMVACNSYQNEKIIFIRFLYDILQEIRGVVISSGNARATATRFRLFNEISDFDFLDIQAINSVKYANNSEMKRRKQAELLVPGHLSVTKIFDIICFSEQAKSTILTIQSQHGMSISTRVNRGWYFTPLTKAGLQ